MIDYEVSIFDGACSKMAPLCADGAFRSVQVPVLSKFPAACLFERSNVTDTSRRTNNSLEEFAVITYESHVYDTTKAGCKAVFSELDDYMISIGFSRMSADYTPNTNNTTVFEYIARYRAEIDRNGVIYRRR